MQSAPATMTIQPPAGALWSRRRPVSRGERPEARRAAWWRLRAPAGQCRPHIDGQKAHVEPVQTPGEGREEDEGNAHNSIAVLRRHENAAVGRTITYRDSARPPDAFSPGSVQIATSSGNNLDSPRCGSVDRSTTTARKPHDHGVHFSRAGQPGRWYGQGAFRFRACCADRVRGSRCGAWPKTLVDHFRRARGRADRDAECAAGVNGSQHRGAARA